MQKNNIISKTLVGVYTHTILLDNVTFDKRVGCYYFGLKLIL